VQKNCISSTYTKHSDNAIGFTFIFINKEARVVEVLTAVIMKRYLVGYNAV
jgi:hypothetical protein